MEVLFRIIPYYSFEICCSSMITGALIRINPGISIDCSHCRETWNMIWHNSVNGFISLFFADADVLRQPFTLQKAWGFLHRLAQKWHKIGTKDLLWNFSAKTASITFQPSLVSCNLWWPERGTSVARERRKCISEDFRDIWPQMSTQSKKGSRCQSLILQRRKITMPRTGIGVKNNWTITKR